MLRRFIENHERGFARFVEILPGLLAWSIILLPAVGGLFFPNVIAYAVLVFIALWFFKSFKAAFFAIRGFFKVQDALGTDWREKYEEEKDQDTLAWNDVKHVIVIPTYNETTSVLERPLKSLEKQKGVDPSQILIVITFEARAEGAKERAAYLEKKYKDKFGMLITTMHPDGIPGEIRGIASNQTWGAKAAHKELTKRKIAIKTLTVTSCDADTSFHPDYYACLTYSFATNPDRYVRFWQSPLFWYNNLHKLPSAIKMLGVIGHAIHLSDLQEPSRITFNMSVYSLSFQLLYDAGYWHVDIIPEDWHLFLQTFFAKNGEVLVEPMFVPTYVDGPESDTWWNTMKNRYKQTQRHAWGASDIPYAVIESIKHPEIPLMTRIGRISKIIETHVIWSTNWFILTFGALLPAVINPAFARTSLGYNLPKVAELVLQICLLALIVMISVDLALRPEESRPKNIVGYIKEIGQWVFFPLITLPLSVLPGLHAQTILMSGKRLEYKTTDKV